MTIALLAAGCAAEDDKGADGDVGNKDVATGGEAFGTADEETAKLGSDAEDGVFRGRSSMPMAPRRSRRSPSASSFSTRES